MQGVYGLKKVSIFRRIEFFVVLGVVAVLASILIPNYVRLTARREYSACSSNLKNLATALEMYSADWNGHYPEKMSSLVPNYFRTIPACPRVGSDSYSESYSRSSRAGHHKLECLDHGFSSRNEECATKLREAQFKVSSEPHPERYSSRELKEIGAVCPDGVMYEYSYSLYTFSYYCSGENHRFIDIPADYPKYGSQYGLVERP